MEGKSIRTGPLIARILSTMPPTAAGVRPTCLPCRALPTRRLGRAFRAGGNKCKSSYPVWLDNGSIAYTGCEGAWGAPGTCGILAVSINGAYAGQPVALTRGSGMTCLQGGAAGSYFTSRRARAICKSIACLRPAAARARSDQQRQQ